MCVYIDKVPCSNSVTYFTPYIPYKFSALSVVRVSRANFVNYVYGLGLRAHSKQSILLFIPHNNSSGDTFIANF